MPFALSSELNTESVLLCSVTKDHRKHVLSAVTYPLILTNEHGSNTEHLIPPRMHALSESLPVQANNIPGSEDIYMCYNNATRLPLEREWMLSDGQSKFSGVRRIYTSQIDWSVDIDSGPWKGPCYLNHLWWDEAEGTSQVLKTPISLPAKVLSSGGL